MTEKSLSEAQTLKLQSFFRSWYRSNGREFPWRDKSVSPFGILLAEMLLRQTRADQVIPVWTRLINVCPEPGALASADPEFISRLVRPLGLWRQRTKALQLMSLALISRHGARVPRNADQLSALPHVGTYGANAVLCFAFKRRVPIVDSNVLRVFSRIGGSELGPDNRRSELAVGIAWQVLPRRGFIEHNYGLLDFSAMICRSRSPLHDECPLRNWCKTYHELPV